MWFRKMGVGILIGVLLCSTIVEAGERESGKPGTISTVEKMSEVPHKIYGKKKHRNKILKMPGKFKLPPDVRIGDIIKTEKGYSQVVDILGNGRVRLRPLNKKHHRKYKTRVKKRYK